MKTFVCAMCILLVLIGAIFANARYMDTVTAALLSDTAALPRADEAGCAAAVAALEARWDGCRHILGLSVNAQTVEQVGDLIGSLRVNCAEGEAADFEVNRARLLHALAQVRELERFSIWNIL